MTNEWTVTNLGIDNEWKHYGIRFKTVRIMKALLKFFVRLGANLGGGPQPFYCFNDRAGSARLPRRTAALEPYRWPVGVVCQWIRTVPPFQMLEVCSWPLTQWSRFFLGFFKVLLCFYQWHFVTSEVPSHPSILSIPFAVQAAPQFRFKIFFQFQYTWSVFMTAWLSDYIKIYSIMHLLNLKKTWKFV